MYRRALEDIRESMDGDKEKEDLSFANICRSRMMTDRHWNHESTQYHLTHPHILQELEHPGGEVVLGGDDLAKCGSWDGLNPQSLEKLIENISVVIRTGYDPTTVKTIIFNAPKLLQVDFAPENGSTCSLRDMCIVVMRSGHGFSLFTCGAFLHPL